MNKKNVIGLIADSTSIADLVLDVFEMYSMRKQQKNGLYLTLGTHAVLSILAVVVSISQTDSIKKEIRECSNKKEGGHWG